MIYGLFALIEADRFSAGTAIVVVLS